MDSEDLVPGSVVKYNETGSRWFVAVVRKKLASGLELELLSGTRVTVPIEKAESFLGYLRKRRPQ
jgi:hypothetical protein